MFPVALVLLAATLQAGPEIPLTTPVANASPYHEELSGVSAGDETALLVWTDRRGIRAARLDRDGRRIDARPIAVGDTPVPVRGITAAGVTRADRRWLVVWDGPDALMGRFVDDQGGLSAPLTLGPRPDFLYQRIAAVFDGTSFLVAWMSYSEVQALRLDADGQPLGAPFVVDTAFPFTGLDAIAFDEGFAILWSGRSEEIHVLRIDGGGNTTRTRLAAGNVRGGTLHAVADGEEIVAVWSIPSELASDVMIAREGSAPRLLGHGSLMPRDLVTIGGTVFAVITSEDDRIELISEDGTRRRTLELPKGVDGVAASSFGDRAVLSAGLAVPEQYSRDLETLVIDATLADAGLEQHFAADVPTQEHPAIARGANGESLAVWVEITGGAEAHTLMGVRLDASGRPVAAPVKIDSLLWPHGVVRVASDGEDYLVVWETWRRLMTLRVERDGTPAGAAVQIPFAWPGEACVAWTGGDYVVGWISPANYIDGNLSGKVQARTVSREGVHGSDVPVSGDISSLRNLVCAAGETSTLLVWSQWGQDWQLRGALRTHGGAVSGTIPISPAGLWPAVAANGRSFAVAWQRVSQFPSVMRAMVSEHGSVSLVDTAPLGDIVAGESVKPVALAPFGRGYLLVWGSRDLRALALTADGRAAGEVTLQATGHYEQNPAIAGGDVPVVIYTRGTHLSYPYPSDNRAFTRTIHPAPVPARRRTVRH